MVRYTYLLLLTLTACTQATVAKNPDGSFTASVTRVFSDTALTIETPDGGTLNYSSDAESVGVANMNRLLLDALIARYGM